MKLFSGNAAGSPFRAREGRRSTGDEQEPYLSISRLVIFPDDDGEKAFTVFRG